MKFRNLLLCLGASVAMTSNSFAQVDEVTTFKAIGGVLSGGAVDNVAVYNVTGWGAPSCPTAVYLAIDANSPGYKNNYAAILTARALGANIRAFGTCVAGTPFFSIKTIELQ